MLEGRVGRYVVERLIGAGGMGEVYLARDTDLGRPVALKVLPADVVEDDVRRERLRREARLAAALSHPHVATVFEVLDHGGTIVLAMEYVPGPSLRRLVASGPLPLARILRIGAQVADALAAAHRGGIVHRDVKPDNILFTDDGHAKVTDFGCARELPPPPGGDASSMPTVGDTLTKPGIALGTVNYMAPEQIQGRPVTPESDIFGLGVSLYEAATGRRAFDAPSSAGIVAAVLRDRPPPASALNPEIPPDLDRILDRALEKDPANRYHDARDLAGDLRDLRRRIESGMTTGTLAAEVGASPRRRGLAVAVGVAVVATAAVAALLLAGGLGTRRAGPYGPPSGGGTLRPVATSEGALRDTAISRDGTMVAFVEEVDEGPTLYVTRTRGGARVRLAGGPGNVSEPSFSPDGETVAFTRWDAEGRRPSVMLVPTLGGEERLLVRDAAAPSWSPDGSRLAVVTSVAGRPRTLATIAADGAGLRDVLQATAERPFLRDPAWSPDGGTIAVVRSTGGQNAEIWIVPAQGGAPRPLLEDPTGVFSSEPAFTADGRFVVHVSNRGGATNLWSAPVDGGSPPSRLTTGAGPDVSPGVADDGRIVFANNVSTASIVVVDLASGSSHELLHHAATLWAPRFSPDGRSIAYSRAESDGAWHIWIVPAGGGNPRQLTVGDIPQINPRFTPDGRSVLFTAWKAGHDRIWSVPREGGPAHPLTPEGEDDAYVDVSPDGRRITFSSTKDGVDRVHVRPIEGGAARPLTDGPSTVASWSPDGTLIAFARDRSYEEGIFVIRPDGGGERRVSSTGGWPVWAPDGRGVAYEAKGPEGDQENWIVPLDGGPPRKLPGPAYSGLNYPFAFSPDGRSLVTTNARNVAAQIWLLEP